MRYLLLPMIAIFYLAWLALCSLLALVGCLVPGRSAGLVTDEVEQSDTICKILHAKGLLSDREYDFETHDVAPLYDQYTFLGYQFILGPMMFLLRHLSYFDSFMDFLVRRWMRVHRYFLNRAASPPQFMIFIVNICVGIAQSVGRVLGGLSWLSRLKIEI